MQHDGVFLCWLLCLCVFVSMLLNKHAVTLTVTVLDCKMKRRREWLSEAFEGILCLRSGVPLSVPGPHDPRIHTTSWGLSELYHLRPSLITLWHTVSWKMNMPHLRHTATQCVRVCHIIFHTSFYSSWLSEAQSMRSMHSMRGGRTNSIRIVVWLAELSAVSRYTHRTHRTHIQFY